MEPVLEETLGFIDEGLVYLGADGRISFLNRAAEGMLGLSLAEALDLDFGRHHWNLIRDDGSPCPTEEHPSLITLRTGQPLSREIRGLKRTDGSVDWFSITTRPVFRDGGSRPEAVITSYTDISTRKRVEDERAMTAELLRLISSAEDRDALLRSALSRLKEWSGCEAVGLRLRDGEDYPYFETSGFPAGFVKLENSLCQRDENGDILLGPDRTPLLECMCGNIIQERTDPSKTFFTNSGSFWSSSTTELLAATTEADRQARTRNRCNGAGYESVALVPLRAGGQTFGLVQFNDRRKGRFTEEKVALLERLANHLAGFLARIQAEAEREKLFRQWQMSLKAARLGWWHYDPVSGVSTWDERYSEIFGVAGRQSSNDEILELLHPDDLPRVWAAVEAALNPADPKPYSAEYRVIPPGGPMRWAEAHGLAAFEGQGEARRAVSFAGTVADVTQRKLADQALRYSEEKFAKAFRHSPLWLVIATLDDGRFLEVNETFLKATGYTREEVISRTAADLGLFSDPEERQQILRLLKEHGSVRNLEVKRRTRSGQVLDMLLSMERLPMPGEEALVVVLADITGLKKAQKDKEDLEAQLRQAQKLEAVGTLAGGVAHDFNNVLTAVMGYAELARDNTPAESENRSYLTQILEATIRARALVRQILTFSRKTGVEARPLNLNRQVTETVGLIKQTIPRMVEVELRLAENLGVINGDPNQIEQIVMNLATNANDAMPDGGRLVIETGNVFLDAESCREHLEARPGPYVRLRVSDTGKGMSKEVVGQIFDPFFTTKEAGKGTGLGLSMVYGIVKAHAGFISCSSRPGQGTRFTIFFPALKSDNAQEPLEPKVNPEEIAGGSETILLVDDEEPLQDLGRLVLSMKGYQVLTAGSGEEALEIFRQGNGRIDLVILDVNMPGMGGYKCLVEMIRLDDQAKIIVSSGYSPDGWIKDSLAAGASTYITKPFKGVEMLQAVRRVLDA